MGRVVVDANESIEDFITRYTKYLTDGDFDGLADIYNYPALAVTAMGCQAITEPQQTRDFFKQGREFYLSHHIHGVRARYRHGYRGAQYLGGTSHPRKPGSIWFPTRTGT